MGAFVALGAWFVVLTGWTLGAGELSASASLASYLVSFAPYVLILYLVSRQTFFETIGQKRWLVALVGGALLLRVIMIAAPPLLSDDVYRYVWDGRVAVAGINPFLYPPEAAELAHLRDDAVWPLINHKQVPTIYPPVAQGFFALNAWLGGGVSSLKALFVLVEMCCVALVWLAARRSAWVEQRGTLAATIYLLNPTVCVELAWSGHLDVLAYGTLAAAVMWWRWRVRASKGAAQHTRNVFVVAALLGVSVASKMLPIIAFPLLFFAPRGEVSSWRRVLLARGAMVGLVFAIVAGSYLPYADAGGKLFAGFGTYASKWRGNDGAFRALMGLSESSLKAWVDPSQRAVREDAESKVFVSLHGLDALFLERGWTKQWEGETLPDTTFASDQISQTVAKLVVAFVMGLVLVWLLGVTRRPLRGVLLLLMALFLFSPTVYPWYVAWLVPLAAVQERRISVAAIVFSATSLSAYLAWVSVEQGGEWYVSSWVVGGAALLVVGAMWYDFEASSLRCLEEEHGGGSVSGGGHEGV